MTKYTCKTCKKKFTNKEYQFSNDTDLCILHCEKDDWFEKNDNKYTNFMDWSKSENKIKVFWKVLDKKRKKEKKDTCTLEKIIFPKFSLETELTDKYVIEKNIVIKECSFLDNVSFLRCTFNGKVSIQPWQKFKYPIVFNGCTFNEDISWYTNLKVVSSRENGFNLKIENSTFNKNISFNDQDFKKCRLDFSNSSFNGFVNFTNSTFKDVIFTNAVFNNNVSFRDAVFFNKVDFRDTIFNSDTNFLNIASDKEKLIKVENRETARIIKYQFEKLGNKIEANKYHALELEQKRKELEQKIKKDFWKNIQEYLVFKLHDLSSKHSTNWFSSLGWILVIGFFSIFFVHFDIAKDLFFHPYHFKFEYIGKIWNEFWRFIYIGYMEDDLKSHPLTFLFNKISLGYLYYQFLMSVRKDTRK